jgi:cell division protein FtsI/penicillin-binding protein 2
MTAAVANGGSVLQPRLVSSVRTPGAEQASEVFPGGRVRDTLGVSKRTLQLLHEAMLADVEDPGGTGRGAMVEGFRLAGKTGTAQVEKNGSIDKNAGITWFASFGPYENPRYAVVVMVVSGVSGGTTCAPIAKKVYEAIQQVEQRGKGGALAAIVP